MHAIPVCFDHVRWRSPAPCHKTATCCTATQRVLGAPHSVVLAACQRASALQRPPVTLLGIPLRGSAALWTFAVAAGGRWAEWEEAATGIVPLRTAAGDCGCICAPRMAPACSRSSGCLGLYGSVGSSVLYGVGLWLYIHATMVAAAAGAWAAAKSGGAFCVLLLGLTSFLYPPLPPGDLVCTVCQPLCLAPITSSCSRRFELQRLRGAGTMLRLGRPWADACDGRFVAAFAHQTVRALRARLDAWCLSRLDG